MENNAIGTLHNLIDYDISKFLCAEVKLKDCLPKWLDQANSFQLKTALQKYLEFVSQHVSRIEAVIAEQQMSMVRVSDPIMLALIEETNECLSYCTNAEIKDACLLARVQRINHYKICTYGTASAFAGLLELENYSKIFREAEINEKHIDDRLSQLATYEINNKAKSPIPLPK